MRCRMVSAQELSAEIAALQQEQERLRSALEARGAEKRGLAAELRRLKASIVEEKKAQMASKFKRADVVFLSILNRLPNKAERTLLLKQLRKSDDKEMSDLIWALLNTPEFFFIK